VHQVDPTFLVQLFLKPFFNQGYKLLVSGLQLSLDDGVLLSLAKVHIALSGSIEVESKPVRVRRLQVISNLL
jgi:hypothetical protein